MQLWYTLLLILAFVCKDFCYFVNVHLEKFFPTCFLIEEKVAAVYDAIRPLVTPSSVTLVLGTERGI